MRNARCLSSGLTRALRGCVCVMQPASAAASSASSQPAAAVSAAAVATTTVSSASASEPTAAEVRGWCMRCESGLRDAWCLHA